MSGERKHSYPTTPDGRYFVVRGRLWRASNPALDCVTRDRLVKELMAEAGADAVRVVPVDAETLLVHHNGVEIDIVDEIFICGDEP